MTLPAISSVSITATSTTGRPAQEAYSGVSARSRHIRPHGASPSSGGLIGFVEQVIREAVLHRSFLSPARGSSRLAALFLALWLAVSTACARAGPDNGPELLEGFYTKLAALVTSSVRGRLRDQPDGHPALHAMLPSLEQRTSSDSLLTELLGVATLRELAEPIERDITFELDKPEHEEVRTHLGSPEVQRQLVAAIVAGMRRAIIQLEEDINGR